VANIINHKTYLQHHTKIGRTMAHLTMSALTVMLYSGFKNKLCSALVLITKELSTIYAANRERFRYLLLNLGQSLWLL